MVDRFVVGVQIVPWLVYVTVMVAPLIIAPPATRTVCKREEKEGSEKNRPENGADADRICPVNQLALLEVHLQGELNVPCWL